MKLVWIIRVLSVLMIFGGGLACALGALFLLEGHLFGLLILVVAYLMAWAGFAGVRL